VAPENEDKSQRVAKSVHVRVAPLPAWLDLERFLGAEFERVQGGEAAQAVLLPQHAAEVCARLRGLGVDGAQLSLSVTPPLGRALVRAARLADARARRATTPAFLRPGARASGEGRYSLTPEALALSLADELAGKSVVDACCGSGGNAIAFARAGCDVTAIDIDAERLAEAAHNARLYGVAQRIRFVQGDARVCVPTLRGDVLFIDPPWGRDYDKRATTRTDFDLLDALLALKREELSQYGALWLKLPASFATRSLPASAKVRAVFGEGPGDFRRIKFILAALPAADPAP
jgi:predicted RNA methylase